MARYTENKNPRIKANEILKQFENEWKKNPSVCQRCSLISFQYSVKSWTLSYQVDREYLRFPSLSQGAISGVVVTKKIGCDNIHLVPI